MISAICKQERYPPLVQRWKELLRLKGLSLSFALSELTRLGWFRWFTLGHGPLRCAQASIKATTQVLQWSADPRAYRLKGYRIGTGEVSSRVIYYGGLSIVDITLRYFMHFSKGYYAIYPSSPSIQPALCL